MKFLEWMGRHPILTIFIFLLADGLIVDVIKALRCG
jgi:hypothetical protein